MKKTTYILLFLLPLIPLRGQNTLQTACELPDSLEEISGMTYDKNNNLLWAINDSGNEAVVYGLDTQKCKVVAKVFAKDTYNQDWEAIASNTDGQLFIGDIGNNNYKRKSLKVYWMQPKNSSGSSSIKTLATKVKFPEATSKKGRIVFDFEAMVHIEGYFYFFTKTHKNDGFKGETEVFKAAAVPGTVHAFNIGQIKLCDNQANCKITDAAYNKDTNQLALLSHKNVWLISSFIKNIEAQTIEAKRFKLDKNTQKEGLTFSSQNSLLLSEEKTKGANFLYTLGW